MGGKGGSSGPSRQQQYVYDQFYDQAQSGGGYGYGGSEELRSAAEAGYAAGGGSRDSGGGGGGGSSLGTMVEAMNTQQADFEAQQEANRLQQEQAEADAIKRTNEGLINQLYTSKFAAANTATESVNQKIAEEMGYARVGGADYAISEAEKAERINNKFADLWSPENESKLSGLEKEWGSVGNKWTSGIVRGVVSDEDIASGEGDSAGGKVESSRVFGNAPTDEDEMLGGSAQVLGSA